MHTHIVGPAGQGAWSRAYREGDLDGARALDEELRPAIDLLRVQTNPIAIKTALKLLGHEVGGFRLPLVEADEDELGRVRDCLARLGLLAACRSGVRAQAAVDSADERLLCGSSRSAASARSGRT